MSTVRLNKLRQAMKERQLEAMFITSSVNRRYLTGFTGSAGYVIVTAEQAYLLTDFRYMTQAPEQAKAFTVVEHAPNVVDTIKELLSKWGVGSIGFEQDQVPYSRYAAYKQHLAPVELVPVSGMLEGIRNFKDAEEIAIIEQATAIADRTYDHILSYIKPGVTEKELELEMEFFMRRQGASGPSFETIVASGARSALPHGVASDKPIGHDEFITFDFGAIYNGYVSDLTRTVFVGTPSDKHREIYNVVLESQLHTLQHLKPGMSGKEADALSRDIITAHGYGDAYGHSAGHGIGLEVHEEPRLSKLSDTVLQPGMVVTVEPGIYLPGFGGVRIEDDVLITEDGIRILTHSSKEFTILPV